MADNFWFFLVAIGPVILAGAIVYALLRRRRLSAGEEAAQQTAMERLYDKPQGGRQARPHGR